MTLTALSSGDGEEHWVSVDRLYGNEVNEYTMVNVRAKFPANPPADTIKIGGQMMEPTDRLPIPYSFSDMAGVQHPAVSTRSSVFFSVNPSLAMFKGFARGCFTDGYEWSLQLSPLSSYAPIRVWRIDPFAFCPKGRDGTENCGVGKVKFVDVPEAFTEIVPAGTNGSAQVRASAWAEHVICDFILFGDILICSWSRPTTSSTRASAASLSLWGWWAWITSTRRT